MTIIIKRSFMAETLRQIQEQGPRLTELEIEDARRYRERPDNERSAKELNGGYFIPAEHADALRDFIKREQPRVMLLDEEDFTP